MIKSIFNRLISCLFLLLCLAPHGSNGYRRLQGQTYTVYELEASVIYGFEFNGTSPNSVDVDQLDDLLRLTEVFYKRVLASQFSMDFQDVMLSYKSHDWQKANDVLTIDFGALVTFRDLDLVEGPSEDAVLTAMVNVNTQDYIDGFVARASPGDLFKWYVPANVEILLD
jgi:hypothetical protein